MMYTPLMASCKACIHPDRASIDHQIVNGVPFRTIAATYSLSLGGLSRHRDHVRELLVEAMQARAGERAELGSNLTNRVEKLLGVAEEILTTAKSEKNLTAATGAINACTRLLELCGRLSGELQAPGAGIHFHATKNVTNIVNIRNDDIEVAVLIAEATKGFDPSEIQRLKMLAETAVTQINLH